MASGKGKQVALFVVQVLDERLAVGGDGVDEGGHGESALAETCHAGRHAIAPASVSATRACCRSMRVTIAASTPARS